MAAAKSQVGQPYTWGGTGNGGFDCSGLTQWAYSQAGVDIPRTADQQAIGKQVSADQLQPGDLVVWDGHVAMYSGNGEIVEAGDPVQTNPLRTNNMGMQFKGFWRPTA
ncbi:C40 family peptidase [Corynebacterium sp. KPL4043]|uniref:C40 family peptidase n=1 Tax=Corynebacterium sp. KPL4043 TaxID=3158328 RepID=UPI0032EB6D51